jgi:hypothetical protein
MYFLLTVIQRGQFTLAQQILLVTKRCLVALLVKSSFAMVAEVELFC